MTATCPYEIVDVFADRPYTGNPLAVVLDAEDLSTEQMQAMAREFNLSETTFVLPPGSGADYRVRIFTPGAELPFAGHPSVGTAVTLARLGRIPAGEVIQDCGGGLLPITVTGDRATLTGGSPSLGAEVDPSPLLATAGLTSEDLLGPPPRVAGVGLDHVFLAVSDDAVASARLDLAAARTHDVAKVYVFSWDAERRHAHGRLFAPGLGIMEDPATGSAALALGVWLVAAGLLPDDGEAAYSIAQGAEMGRPSRLDCTVTASGGKAERTTVAGQVVPVARGEIVVP
ncbi:PhzF family phenazine biosynthesis protein [Actinopolymorpha alba]|uniref:PhzF family phenazine biosynthesis protein n=1 Tax=Actinopolymorpha alba TaxID=533267 RepID=UPI0003703E3D|nr:PhzF family phenazine biosynthesis protein [Actinopolymorpha alba]